MSTDSPPFPSPFRGSTPAQSSQCSNCQGQFPSRVQTLPSLPVQRGRQAQYGLSVSSFGLGVQNLPFSAKLTLQLLSTTDAHSAALSHSFPSCQKAPEGSHFLPKPLDTQKNIKPQKKFCIFTPWPLLLSFREGKPLPHQEGNPQQGNAFT